MADTITAPDVDAEDLVDDDGVDTEPLVDDIIEIPVHGVAAVTGVPTGDGRMFANDALTNRDLPLPMRFEFVGTHGGDTSMVDTVGRIDKLWMQGNEMRYTGSIIMSTTYGPQVVGGIIDGIYKGVSVEVDDITVDVSQEREEMKARIQEEQARQAAADEVEVGEDGDLEVKTQSMTDAEIDEMLDQWFGDGTTPLTTFSAARVCGFTIVPIPAYAEAYIALGPDFPDGLSDESKAALAASGCDCAEPSAEEWQAAHDEFTALVAGLVFAISEDKWDGSASRFDDAQWKASCVLDKGSDYDTAKTRYALPIKEPNGDLSRAGVHAAAGRVNQVDASDSAKAAAKAKLRGAYKSLGEDAPDSITASATSVRSESEMNLLLASGALDPEAAARIASDEDVQRTFDEGGPVLLTAAAFAPGTHDGPGWITNPRATARIRRYWTHGKGAAKIRWGEPGDFNRCRKQLVKYVQNPDWLAGLCANMHKEAIGVWPGQEDGGRGKHQTKTPLTIVASVRTAVEADYFRQHENPEHHGVVIDGDLVFGYVAAWGVCHVGIGNICTVAPHSLVNYAYFATGFESTDEGDIAVGQITMGTGHASDRLGMMPAVSHYDDTGSAVADIAVGEDDYGIWFSGKLRPSITDKQRHDLKASGRLSGDWREMGLGLELCAALVVNVPGFPMPRTSLSASGLQQTSLVAAGIVIEGLKLDEVLDIESDTPSPLTVAAFVAKVATEMRRQDQRENRLAAIRAKQPQVRALRLNRIRSRIITKED